MKAVAGYAADARKRWATKYAGLPSWTVIGFYRDNNQRAAFAIKAINPTIAEALAVRRGTRQGGDFVACAVAKGDVQLVDKHEWVNL